ncbi:L-type lectin-domain containing receptor kinase V.9-like [Cornus florida]|uniref:L-type lectin-domain containing receptor kinase V.9-like n=1 Tax=Cornus florida TaxID=4283 RepID=UPI002897C90A|nr:L-type lectin-domain containing receptor kinase V.9-like [Cornus florida]
MLSKAHLLLFLLIKVVSSSDNGFTFYKSFKLVGEAEIAPDGLFKHINETSWGIIHTFYSLPFGFKNSLTGNALSFSTMFVFEIVPEIQDRIGLGMGFVIAPSKEIPGAGDSQHLGLVNLTNDGQPSNHMVSIRFDTSKEKEFGDINDNHVGININSIRSIKSAPAGYFKNENGEFKNLSLTSGEPIQAWVEYDGIVKQLNVTLSPININKPNLPLLSLKIDLSPIFLDQMYVGFSSSIVVNQQSHYVLGWSFQLNGKAEELDLSKLRSLSHEKKSIKTQITLAIGLSLMGIILATTIIFIIFFWLKRKAKYSEILEDWEVQYGPHRFQYKDLFLATEGFKDTELLGRGGFGEVYKGALPMSNVQIAVKRISHNARQGMKEFVAEIATIGRVRHPNLVRLLGYCRRKCELYLIYDLMTNTSLDKFIFNETNAMLKWNQRFKIIKDIASGLAYLHEEWVEVIVHRDIKASNVLLDDELNGKLGEFGLARCNNHGKDPQTTHLAGTLGYIAPELARNGKATTSSDVFAFGAFCLEVACGRRPVEHRAPYEEVILVDWVLECWRNGEILKVADSKLKGDFKVDELELILKLGLLCSHPAAAIRPSMSQVLQYLNGHALIPEKLDSHWTEDHFGGTSQSNDSKPSLTITELFIVTGR